MNTTRDERRRTVLAVVAFVAGGAVPIQLVTLSFGYAQYVKGIGMGPQVFSIAHEVAALYIPFVLIPALVALLAIGMYSRKRYPDLYRRMIVGLTMGALATVALDAVREAGVIHGWLPGDSPVMFGKMATDSANFSTYYPAGLFIHYLNGANFGLFYAFVWGRRRSYGNAAWWATVWALILELGMMTGPPMGPMVGLFGYNYAWPQLFALTFVAHVVYGVVMGVLIQHFLTEDDRTWLVPFLMRSPNLAGRSLHNDTLAAPSA